MNKFSKVIALALATTMVLGSAVTAFATEPVTTGDSTGAGTSEGHVEKKATNVVLPTIESNETPFAYTMDPEGLIQETAGAKYSNVIFPAAASDKHVYFNNGADSTDSNKTVYANSSLAQIVKNKSSFDIKLTVKAEVAQSADTDIALVASDALADASAASLYLGLVVGSEDPVAVSKTTAAEVTVDVTGTPGNFKIDVNEAGDGYEYRELTLDEYKELDGNSAATQTDFDASWDSTTIQLEGAVTTGKAITSDTTAPSIKVTWSWVDPEATPAAPAITDETATVVWHNSTFWLGSSTSAGLVSTEITNSDLTTVTLKANDHNAVDVSSVATIGNDNGYWVKVKYSDAAGLGLEDEKGTYTFVVVIDNKRYTGTYTFQ